MHEKSKKIKMKEENLLKKKSIKKYKYQKKNHALNCIRGTIKMKLARARSSSISTNKVEWDDETCFMY